jgi:hypothetical protein
VEEVDGVVVIMILRLLTLLALPVRSEALRTEHRQATRTQAQGSGAEQDWEVQLDTPLVITWVVTQHVVSRTRTPPQVRRITGAVDPRGSVEEAGEVVEQALLRVARVPRLQAAPTSPLASVELADDEHPFGGAISRSAYLGI